METLGKKPRAVMREIKTSKPKTKRKKKVRGGDKMTKEKTYQPGIKLMKITKEKDR